MGNRIGMTVLLLLGFGFVLADLHTEKSVEKTAAFCFPKESTTVPHIFVDRFSTTLYHQSHEEVVRA